MGECYVQSNCKKYMLGQCPNPKFCIKKFKVDKFYDSAMLPPTLRDYTDLNPDICDLGAYDELKKIMGNVESFVSSGNNLYIHSVITGNGKTVWASKILKSYINSIWHKHDLTPPALFISVPRYLLSIKDFSDKNDYSSLIKQYVMTAEVVVWDDIATKDSTEFERENLLSIIDSRMSSGLSNIFTSNADPSELYSILGKRLSSRILGNSIKIQLAGKDKRNGSITVN